MEGRSELNARPTILFFQVFNHYRLLGASVLCDVESCQTETKINNTRGAEFSSYIIWVKIWVLKQSGLRNGNDWENRFNFLKDV